MSVLAGLSKILPNPNTVRKPLSLPKIPKFKTPRFMRGGVKPQNFNGDLSINLNRRNRVSPNYVRPTRSSKNPINQKIDRFKPSKAIQNLQSGKVEKFRPSQNVLNYQNANTNIVSKFKPSSNETLNQQNKNIYLKRALQNRQSGLRFQKTQPTGLTGVQRSQLIDGFTNVRQRSGLRRYG